MNWQGVIFMIALALFVGLVFYFAITRNIKRPLKMRPFFRQVVVRLGAVVNTRVVLRSSYPPSFYRWLFSSLFYPRCNKAPRFYIPYIQPLHVLITSSFVNEQPGSIKTANINSNLNISTNPVSCFVHNSTCRAYLLTIHG